MGLDTNTFGIVNFKGYEAISKIYDFEIMLVSSKNAIDLQQKLGQVLQEAQKQMQEQFKQQQQAK